jgi:hypothetical protein
MLHRTRVILGEAGFMNQAPGAKPGKKRLLRTI